MSAHSIINMEKIYVSFWTSAYLREWCCAWARAWCCFTYTCIWKQIKELKTFTTLFSRNQANLVTFVSVGYFLTACRKQHKSKKPQSFVKLKK